MYDGDRYTSNISIHIELGVRSLNEGIKRAPAKRWQHIRQHENSVTTAQGNYYIHTNQAKADLTLTDHTSRKPTRDTLCRSGSSKQEQHRTDTPHLRSQGPPSYRCFYPHIIIQPSWSLAFKVPYIYDYIVQLCRRQAEALQNHENANVRKIGRAKPETGNNRRLEPCAVEPTTVQGGTK
jgi:hypothetical protein